MSNPNVADISVFEGLQNQAHESMGMPQSQMAVFNWSANIVKVAECVNLMKEDVADMRKVQGDIDRMQQTRDRTQDKDYDSLIERNKAIISRIPARMHKVAQHALNWIKKEQERLGFTYTPGQPVPRNGVDDAVYKERKQLADAVNTFYTGKLANGNTYASYLK
jgi:hypothetical protein